MQFSYLWISGALLWFHTFPCLGSAFIPAYLSRDLTPGSVLANETNTVREQLSIGILWFMEHSEEVWMAHTSQNTKKEVRVNYIYSIGDM